MTNLIIFLTISYIVGLTALFPSQLQFIFDVQEMRTKHNFLNIMKASKKKEKHTHFSSVDKDLIRNYAMEIQAARNSPRQYYSNDGRLKTIK